MDGGAAISVGNKHIANWLIGQVRYEDINDEQVLKYADEIGANRMEFQEALLEVTPMSKVQFENACNSLFLFANQLSKIAFQNLELRKNRELLKEFNQELENIVKERTAELDSANRDLKKALEDLQKAFDSIKTLKGLLPICSNCKKIRDDKGYWNQIEKYIESYTDVSFSHGVCPECAEKLYGDQYWYKKKI